MTKNRFREGCGDALGNVEADDVAADGATPVPGIRSLYGVPDSANLRRVPSARGPVKSTSARRPSRPQAIFLSAVSCN